MMAESDGYVELDFNTAEPALSVPVIDHHHRGLDEPSEAEESLSREEILKRAVSALDGLLDFHYRREPSQELPPKVFDVAEELKILLLDAQDSWARRT